MALDTRACHLKLLSSLRLMAQAVPATLLLISRDTLLAKQTTTQRSRYCITSCGVPRQCGVHQAVYSLTRHASDVVQTQVGCTAFKRCNTSLQQLNMCAALSCSMSLHCCVFVTSNTSPYFLQGTYAGYDQTYSAYGSSAQGSVPAAVADAAQSLPAESQQKLANIVAKVCALCQHSQLLGLPASRRRHSVELLHLVGYVLQPLAWRAAMQCCLHAG